MRVARSIALLALAALFFTFAAGAAPDKRAATITPAPAFAPLDLAAPAGPDWATYGGDYGQTRYSSLTQMTTRNVRRLKLAWHVHLNGSGTASKYKGEGTPLVYKGIMYLVTGQSDVFAIDASNGAILWEHTGGLPETIPSVCCGWSQRGLALGDGKVFVSRLDATVVALSQQTGDVVWTASNGNPADGATATGAPLYYNGLVIVGVSGGEFGVRGSITAYDARDGHRVWRFYTAAAPGETGGGTWSGTEWQTGGGPVWSTPSVDAKRGLLYFTTGNAFPWSGRGPGDDLFTSSIVALNAMTGAYAWHFQVVHHDIWDYDCGSNPVLFTRPIGRLVHKVVAAVCKTGWVYELDRKSGRPSIQIDEKPVPQSAFQHTAATQPIPVGDSFANQCSRSGAFPRTANDGARFRFGCVFTPYDARGFTAVAPGAAGGTTWNPTSYSPRTGYLYVCSRDSQNAYKATGTAFAAKGWVGVEVSPEKPMHVTTGAFTAMKTSTNTIAWRRTYKRAAYPQTDASCGSGSVATAGGLVFMGLPQGMYHGLAAYDARTGSRLWRAHTDAGVEAPPITYGIGNEQYVAVFAGGRVTHGTPAIKGDDLYAFSLGGSS